MKKIIRVIGVTVCALSFLLSAEEIKKRPMTVDDGLNMVSVGSALMSPDGKSVFYSLSELDWAKNKRKSTYDMISADGGDAYQYIGEAGGSSFQFSPDGKSLSFTRPVEQKAQIFLMPTGGGEAVQLTNHENAVGPFRWSQDSTMILFLAEEPRSKDDEKKYKAGDDAVFVDEGPNGQTEGSWNALWQFDVKAKKETKLTNEKLNIGGFDLSPDGTRILYTARFENRRNQGYLSEIYLFNIKDKTKTRLTDNRAPEGGLLWAPDGKSFVYSAPDDKVWELRNSKIWVMDPETKLYRMISGQFEGNIQGYIWTPDGASLLFSGLQKTNSNLFKLEAASGKLTKLTNLTGSLQVSSYSKDRKKMVYSFSDFDTPGDLYVSSTEEFKPVRLTDANPWVKKDLLLAGARVIRWKSKDGLEVEGLLFLPPDYQPGKKVPLMLNIHGGPAGSFSNRFSSIYHIYAGLGYASFCPNVRGSSGSSDGLLRGNMRDIGGGDYWDLMTGVDCVVKEGYADPDKLGLRGWSYGGILGGWTVTQTNRFKAASVGAMVSDWTSEYGPGFNHDVRLWYIGGTPWDNPKGYREKSSLTHAKNVTTPTLILHGANDTTDTEAQSMNFFATLKDMGKTVRYIKFPREPHGFGEPHHQRIRDIEEIAWMQKYVQGMDWKPWERKDEDKKEEKK
jgi:dipeptidyl aminopeptidase/acylaminoacyl peptidase